MTLAVVIAGDARDDRLPAERIAGQWRQAGAAEVRVVADLAELAELAAAAERPLVVSGADLVAHTAVLRHLLTAPMGPTGALVLTDAPAAGQAVVREERGQVVRAGAVADAEATGIFGGALKVGVADLPALARAAAEAGHAHRPGHAQQAGQSNWPDPAGREPVDELLVRFAAAGAPIFAQRVRLLVAHRITDAAQLAAAEAEVAAVDSDRAELRLSVKERDDLFTTYCVSTWSPQVAKLAARIGLGPTAVTMISVFFAVAAAGLFAVSGALTSGARLALVAGGVLLYLGFVLDCVDGQLARYTRNFSAWGGWLDTMADRAKEYLVYAGLGIGVELAGLGPGWALAIAAMTLQTVRHMTDTWYGVLHDEAARRPAPDAATGGLGGRLSQASNRVQADTGSAMYWIKRTVVFPIGERWALIAVTAALFNPLVSLVAVLAWGALAFAYTMGLRTLRARSMRVAVMSTVDARLHRDDGPLLRRLPGFGAPLPVAVLAALAAGGLLLSALTGAGATAVAVGSVLVLLLVLAAAAAGGRPHTGALDWLVPAALRAAEYLLVIAVGVAGDVPAPLIFALLFVLALRHYDLTARLEKRQAAPPLHDAGLGGDGRAILLVAALLAGITTYAVATLSVYLLSLFVVSVILTWAVSPRRAPRPQAAAADSVKGVQTPG